MFQAPLYERIGIALFKLNNRLAEYFIWKVLKDFKRNVY